MTALYASDSPAGGCEDGALCPRIAAGDLAAAEELVRRYQGPVRGFLRAVCFDRQAVDDLAQETFLRALKNADRFDPKYPLRGWLLTIARRLSINHGDKARRRRPQPGVELAALPDTADATPAAPLEREEQKALTRSEIDRALQQLTEPQRTTIAMHYQQGLALDQIADLLDMRLGTVKSHLHRGRKRMRELLEPQAERLLP